MYSIRAQPGRGAGAGFVVGLLRDALTPASFGAGALAHTLVAYLAAWGKAVFFAENVWVNGYLFFAGTWLRNLVVAIASGKLRGTMLGWELLVWSPLQSAATAVAGVLVLWLFGRQDRKSTRLNSSHGYISYAVFCLKKKKNNNQLHKLLHIESNYTSCH